MCEEIKCRDDDTNEALLNPTAVPCELLTRQRGKIRNLFYFLIFACQTFLKRDARNYLK